MECIIYNKYDKHYYNIIISILIIVYCFTYINSKGSAKSKVKLLNYF